MLSGCEFSLLFTSTGVPQGFILWPLLLLIYINDKEHNIISDLGIFSDDTTLAKEYKNVSDVERVLNADLCALSKEAQ